MLAEDLRELTEFRRAHTYEAFRIFPGNKRFLEITKGLVLFTEQLILYLFGDHCRTSRICLLMLFLLLL
jgi:hypothetical protein